MYRKFTGDNNRRPRQSMKLQQVYSLTRKAIDDYHMIQSGDRIAVGISGGKDSLTLLYALQGLRRFYPHPFELCAVTVDLLFEFHHLRQCSRPFPSHLFCLSVVIIMQNVSSLILFLYFSVHLLFLMLATAPSALPINCGSIEPNVSITTPKVRLFVKISIV